MFGNTNRGPQGFNLESVRGVLPGQSGAGMDKIQSGVMEMIQNMDADALEGLRQALNGGPYNAANTTLAAKTAAAATTKPTQFTEQQRVQELESWRTPENGHFIDEAIASGESPGDAALRIVNASIRQEEAVNQMVAYAHELIDRRNGRL